MSCCVTKNYYSPQKKTDFAVEYGGNSAQNEDSATILQFVPLRGEQSGTLYRPRWKGCLYGWNNCKF